MLELPENISSGECPYCGTLTTFPKISGDHQENLYNRAEHFRRINEYDKAVAAYEKIIEATPDDPEAYWGLVLSRFGIEYVEDPLTHERIPTCHRVQFESILNDADYLAALNHAGSAEKEIYEREAKRIADIQKNILRVSNQEKPFDVFICYKETTDGGSRTKDSALAQDIYYQLTNAGYKVFFARITLESKLGQQYEPYIFAALNSAKVMLVIGSKKEYFEAVWVRNEWSRFLALMKKDRSKLLIPCYKDMDAYDIPDELSMFQAQDMGKIGFIQDLLHGIAKVVAKNDPSVAPAPAAPANIGDVNSKDHPFLQRAKLFLETEEFDSAKEYCEKLLDLNPQNGWAYFYRMMAENKVGDEKLLLNIDGIDQQKTFQLAKRFADNRLAEILDEIINFRIEEERRKAEEEQNRYRKQLVCLCQRYSDRRQEEEQRRAEEEQRLREEKRRQEEEQRFKKILLYLLLPIIGIVSIAVAVFIAFPYIRGYKSDGKTLIEVTDKNITEFTIPDGVTEIENWAFRGCSSLKSITIPDSVTKIWIGAFRGCKSLKSVTIPDSVTVIENGAFSGCSSLTSVTIPDSVTWIGWGTFEGCSSLKSITIPDSVTVIKARAFRGCSSLKSITIPDSVKEIWWEAFRGCKSLKSVMIPQNCIVDSEAFPDGCEVIRR